MYQWVYASFIVVFAVFTYAITYVADDVALLASNFVSSPYKHLIQEACILFVLDTPLHFLHKHSK